MDIFNRIPAISEDTLVYYIYPVADSADKSAVTAIAASIEALVESLLPNHIWHRDAFELRVVNDKFSSSASANSRASTTKNSLGSSGSTEDHWMLEGYMRVGDSVDDEWLTVWLLKEVSSRLDVAVTVYDSDGEFLLIEAAEHLPSWVTPENSENRVWLYQGRLHLIPLSYMSAPSSRANRRRKLGGHESDEGVDVADDSEEWLNAHDALSALKLDNSTEAPRGVQEAVWSRISGYPTAARQHIHITKAFLPLDIAKALDKEPTLVQRAVEAFYTRDAIQLRAAHKMSRFPPQSSVFTSVRMTRTAYAQLLGQKFHPPKIFGRVGEREGTAEWKWKDVGMKIACGFEMLYQESKSKTGGVSIESQKASADARMDALRRNTDYNEYVKKLRSTGYFKGEIDGSALWNELEGKAADVFVNSRRDGDSSRSPFATLVNTAVSRAGDFQSFSDLPEDSDDWLNIDADNLDQKLAETMHASSTKKAEERETAKDAMDVDRPNGEDEEARLAQVQADQLKGLASKIERFVEGEGTLEGAVFEDEQESEDGDDGLSEFTDEHSDSDSENGQAQPHGAEGVAAKQARQEAMDQLVSGLNPGDYGKMPASFYSNSQQTAPVTMETESRDEIKPTAPGQVARVNSQPARPIRRPILPRDDFDGVDSDDETDDDNADEESEEERPQVVGEVEVDMGAEQEEFLEFSRAVLDIPDEMWDEILRDRRNRGAFVPKGLKPTKAGINETNDATHRQPISKTGPASRLRSPQSGPRPNANPALDSFEAVMEAMEAELSKSRLSRNKSKSTVLSNTHSTEKSSSLEKGKAKGKGKAVSFADGSGSEDDDVDAAMEVELRAALEREDDSGDEEPMDYGMIRNFLESFKSQAGLAGPVGALAGRLEPNWNMPRDES